ncbi:electron transporter [Perilla frutescens var. hirtella]|uniref:Electron transporter n=1 Tax=Perilla frutescens var. hirtella TaxID=608512 RepID=A0AAD4P9N9_PERFH|nr:electron transporter [Perilla frutescens var. hirtella]
MGFERFSSSNLPGLVRHQRSKSFPDSKGSEESKLVQSAEAASGDKLDVGTLNGCTNSKQKLSSNAEIQHSLRQEILMLEKRLHDQVSVRCALERALGYRASSHDITNDAIIPKPATELIKEISVLELEVGHLEQYLLSLYRKAFDQQVCTISPSKKDEGFKSPLTTPRRRRLDFSRSAITPATETLTSSNLKKEANSLSEEKPVDSGVQRSHSSLSQRSALANRTSPPSEALGKAVRACHSQPLSMMEYAQNSSSHVISLAEHLGTRISDHIPESPNRLSEEMVKCMSSIYCKLADPPGANHGLSSPASSLSSISAFSPKDQCDLWSPGFRNDSSFDVRLDNPFHVEGLKDFSGPYSSMIEVNCIYRDSQKLGDIEFLLQNFRSLISRLEEINPKKMSHEEKLAFWINVHNALVMHAFLAYGVPQNNMKRMFLLLKAAYNVGGQIVSADVIQSSILGCRLSRPGQWLRLLLSSKTKFKAGDERQAYGIERPEPLLYFALSSGSHSDPAVRIFTPKRVFQELEAAKDDYIRATFGVRKDHKILLPKLFESFAKDSGLRPDGILEMIQHSLPDSLRRTIKKCQQTKTRKNIEWVPHNFAFRYLILKETAK